MWQTFFSAQGIERDGAVRDVECAQQLLRGGDLVGFFRDIDVRQDPAGRSCTGPGGSWAASR
jgi:hypothetical protein